MKLSLIILSPTADEAAKVANFLPSRQRIGVSRFFALLNEAPSRPTPFLDWDDVKFALGGGDEAMGIRAGVLLSQTSWGFLVCRAGALPTEDEVAEAVTALKSGEAWRSPLLWGATREWLIAEGFTPLLSENAETVIEAGIKAAASATPAMPTAPATPVSRAIPSGADSGSDGIALCMAGEPVKLPILITALREVANLTSVWTEQNSLGGEWEKVVASQIRREYPAAESATLSGATFIGSGAEETALRVLACELLPHPVQCWLFIGPKNEKWAAPLAAKAAHTTLRLEGTGNRRLACFAPADLAALL